MQNLCCLIYYTLSVPIESKYYTQLPYGWCQWNRCTPRTGKLPPWGTREGKRGKNCKKYKKWDLASFRRKRTRVFFQCAAGAMLKIYTIQKPKWGKTERQKSHKSWLQNEITYGNFELKSSPLNKWGKQWQNIPEKPVTQVLIHIKCQLTIKTKQTWNKNGGQNYWKCWRFPCANLVRQSYWNKKLK